MDKSYNPQIWEPKIIESWEKTQEFKADPTSDKSGFCIVLPPPNANGSLHAGHVLMVVQDIMARYARQTGHEVLYLPGLDHAGFETQFVFEKHLKKQDKSRFDFTRDELYREIEKFVDESRGKIETQFKQIGFSLDWSAKQYTLNPDIQKTVYATFKKLFDDGLVYRAHRLVNYCIRDGTSFSDLECESTNIKGLIYTIKYPLVNPSDSMTHIEVATTRPETMFADVAIMVNPKDTRYKNLIGKTAQIPYINREIPIIADEAVDPEFGTGAVKVTPAHDFTDAEVGRRHNLWHEAIIRFNGKIAGTNTKYDGLKIKPAREELLKDLQTDNLLQAQKEHELVAKTCYKCGQVLEPLPLDQWFIKIEPLKKMALEKLENGEIQVHPARFKDTLKQILENYIDWNISRQIVWGMRIPAFYNSQTDKWVVETDESKQTELKLQGFAQETDTFDTWFSSGQWPYATLKSLSAQTGLDYYSKFYPTTILETGYDIARAWVARMIMLGVYATGCVPFKNVYLHGMVRDGKGQKMSKSRGNVIDPLTLTTKHGTDALRLALVFSATPGADISLSEDKVVGMRNFVNKIWNIGRFIQMLQEPQPQSQGLDPKKEAEQIASLQNEFKVVKDAYIVNMQKYNFSQILVDLHEFVWHRFADVYIEELKNFAKQKDSKSAATLKQIYLECITLLKPFAPFVTTAIEMEFTK